MRYFLIILTSIFVLIGCGSKTNTTSIKEQPADNKQELTGEAPSQDLGDIPSPDEFIEIDKYPEQLYEKVPKYPDRALFNNEKGNVIIEAFIDEKGLVVRAHSKACTNPGYGFEDAAVKAAYECRYKPAVQKGLNVSCWISYVVQFLPEEGSISDNRDYVENSVVQNKRQSVVSPKNWPPPPDSIHVDELPRPFQLVKPKYPKAVPLDKLDAIVTLGAYINSSGHAIEIEVITTNNPSISFRNNAKEAAEKTQFTPAKNNGKKIGVWVYYDVIFNKLAEVSLGKIKQLLPNTKEELTAPKESIISPDEFIPVDVHPELISEEIPQYPEAAIEKGKSAYVILQVYVNEAGNVLAAEIVKCSNPGWGFEKAALQSSKQNRYKPALRDGKPIGIWISYKIEFRL